MSQSRPFHGVRAAATPLRALVQNEPRLGDGTVWPARPSLGNGCTSTSPGFPKPPFHSSPAARGFTAPLAACEPEPQHPAGRHPRAGRPPPGLMLASAPALSAPVMLPPSALVLAVPAAGGQPAAVAPRTPDWFYAGQLLGNGVVGRDVCRVQSFLHFREKASLRIDGIYGPKTTRAVRDFQRRSGSAADGIVGEATWNKGPATAATHDEVPCPRTAPVAPAATRP